MITLALTGSIGMGKSTVAAMFAEAGIPTFDADAMVRQLQGPGGRLVPLIEARFPGTTSGGAVDREALSALVARYHDRVLRIVRARLGPGLRNHLDSQDLVQDTFAAVVRDFEHYEVREEASLVHWLARLAQDDETLEVALALTRQQPEGWTGFRRRIDRPMLAEIAWPPSERPHVFVCGPTPLVESAASALVELGHDPALVKTERFGPTGGSG